MALSDDALRRGAEDRLHEVITDPELGPVRLCAVCREYWPDDEEFYAAPGMPCHACYADLVEELRVQRRERRRDYMRAFRQREDVKARAREASRRYRASRVGQARQAAQ